MSKVFMLLGIVLITTYLFQFFKKSIPTFESIKFLLVGIICVVGAYYGR